jgi:AcrR family transcriptional regulator
MTAPEPVRSDQTRQKILDAALELFRERGFEAATMRDIAGAAGVSTGLAYYYFTSKEDLVMAFYLRTKDELAPLLERAHRGKPKIEDRLRALIQTKFEYFAPNRKFLAALMGHAIIPKSPLSPFSAETQEIREADMAQIQRALRDTDTNVAKDLADHLAKILWLYQLVMIFYWLYDDSPGQKRACTVLEKSVWMVVLLIRLSDLPMMRTLRKRVVEIAEVVES